MLARNLFGEMFREKCGFVGFVEWYDKGKKRKWLQNTI